MKRNHNNNDPSSIETDEKAVGKLKPTAKSMLKSALVIFILGLVVTVVSWIVCAAKDINLYSSSLTENDYRTFTQTINEILDNSENATKNHLSDDSYPIFTAVDISSLVGSIEIVSTDTDSFIEFNNVDINNLNCCIDGDILVISEKYPVSFMGFEVNSENLGFAGLRQIFLLNTAKSSRSIILHLNPEQIPDLVSANIYSIIGTVSIDGLTAGKIQISDKYGKVTVTDSSANSEIRIDGNKLNVDFTNNKYQKCNIKTILGDIKADVNCGVAILKTDIGSVYLTVSGSLDEYGIMLEPGRGSITANGVTLSEKSIKHLRSTTDTVKVNTTLGSISVTYDPQYTLNANDTLLLPETTSPDQSSDATGQTTGIS